MTMDFKNKKTTIALIVCAVILALIGWRVWANIQAKKAEANRSGKEKVAVVTAAYPERKTIVPKFRFSGTLDPVWQADVAAKVDGRIEQVLVNEGDAVSAGEVLAILDRTDTDASLLNAKGLYADAKTDYEKRRQILRVIRSSTQQALFPKKASTISSSPWRMRRASWMQHREI